MTAAEIIAALRSSPALCDQVIEGLCIAGPWSGDCDYRVRIAVGRSKVVAHVYQDGGLWAGWALGQDLSGTWLSAEEAETAVDQVLQLSSWTLRGAS